MTHLDRMKAMAADESRRMLAVMDRPMSEVQGAQGNETILSLLSRDHTANDVARRFGLTTSHVRTRLNELQAQGLITAEIVKGIRVYRRAEVSDAAA